MKMLSRESFLRVHWMIALVGGVIGISYLLKEFFISVALSYGDVVLIPYFLGLTLAWNRGVSYGLFAYSGEFSTWIVLWGTLTLSLVFLLWGLLTSSRSRAWGLTLIASGGLANVINRLENGAVSDYLVVSLVPPFPPFICNFADIIITFGGVFFLWQEVILYRKIS